MFGQVKETMSAREFASSFEVKDAIHMKFQSKPKAFIGHGINNLVNYHTKMACKKR
jgi:hypothetical protein